ncbi:MerR family transcriptional regulator [Micromonospora zhanjiangensis]|uniref:MerR family transcriptional regulator n=1 Tax=Micromonospora zhanjiangensis TaxID=1522057 RepID=A0ABV8KQE0_9ACTN
MDTHRDEMTWTVSEAAERVGLTAYTLRWYEQEGLLDRVGRDSAGRRRYTKADLDWLVLLTRLRRTGMPIRDMRRYADLARQGEGTIGSRLALFRTHRDRVLTRIAELEQDLAALNHKIDMYGRLVEAGGSVEPALGVPARTPG